MFANLKVMIAFETYQCSWLQLSVDTVLLFDLMGCVCSICIFKFPMTKTSNVCVRVWVRFNLVLDGGTSCYVHDINRKTSTFNMVQNRNLVFNLMS